MKQRYLGRKSKKKRFIEKKTVFIAFSKLTWESFHEDAFSGLPNLQELSFHGNEMIQDLDPSYFVEKIPSLKKIFLHNTNNGFDCWCQGVQDYTGDFNARHCNQCAIIPFCESLCGIHPELTECHSTENRNLWLRCDSGLNKHNGTWMKREVEPSHPGWPDGWDGTTYFNTFTIYHILISTANNCEVSPDFLDSS